MERDAIIATLKWAIEMALQRGQHDPDAFIAVDCYRAKLSLLEQS